MGEKAAHKAAHKTAQKTKTEESVANKLFCKKYKTDVWFIGESTGNKSEEG